LGANQITIVEAGDNAGEHIVNTCRDINADIVILSGTSRTGGGDVFLGHTIHHVLENIDATVVVAITPGPRDPQAVQEDELEAAPA